MDAKIVVLRFAVDGEVDAAGKLVLDLDDGFFRLYTDGICRGRGGQKEEEEEEN